MTPDLRYLNKSDLDPQTQWDTFKAQLNYVLAFPESEAPEAIDLPTMIYLFGATPINITSEEFEKDFMNMANNEILGDDLTKIKVKSTEKAVVTNSELIEALYKPLGINEAIEIKPFTIFFLDANLSASQDEYSSAVMIIPIEIEDGYIVVQAVPIQGNNEFQDPILRELQKYWTGRTKIANGKRTVKELLEIKGIKRASQL